MGEGVGEGQGKVSVYPWQETRSTPVGPHVRQRREYVFGIPGIIFGHSGGCGYLAATRRKKYPRDRVPLPLFSLFLSLFLRSMILREGGRGLSWNEVDQWTEEVKRDERGGGGGRGREGEEAENVDHRWRPWRFIVIQLIGLKIWRTGSGRFYRRLLLPLLLLSSLVLSLPLDAVRDRVPRQDTQSDSSLNATRWRWR